MNEEELIHELKSLSAENIFQLNKKLAKTSFPILGVSVPNIRKLAKKYRKEDLSHIPFHSSLEMDQLLGVWNALCKGSEEEKWEYLEQLLYDVDSWAITDVVLSSYHFTNDETILQKYLSWKASPSVFLNRSAHILFLTTMVKKDQAVSWYLSTIKETGNYYVDMAICWVLATIGIRHFEEVIEFLKQHQNEKFIYQNTIRKMRESRRIEESHQQILRAMK